MKNYELKRFGDASSTEMSAVAITDGKRHLLQPFESIEVANHSITFAFGDTSNGSLQLALAILMNYLGYAPSLALYTEFRGMFIAPVTHPSGVITGTDIQSWLDTRI